MQYPMLPVEKKSTNYIDLFGGYNHNEKINENEFYDMQNMTSDSYPLLASRKNRGLPNITGPEYYSKNTRGFLYKSDLYQVCTNQDTISLIKNGTHFHTLNNRILDANIERQLVMMGAYIVVLPDKVYFNVTSPGDSGEIETSLTSDVGESIIAQPCDIDGNTYEINCVSDTIPEIFWDGFIWLDTHEEPFLLKQYTIANSTWMPLDDTYIKLTCKNIGKNIKDGDGINLSGFVEENMKKLNGSTVIYSVIDDNNIIIKGVLDYISKEFVLKVHSTQKLSETNKEFFAYCDKSLAENALANKEIIVDGNKMICISNTAPTPSRERRVSEDESKWLAKGSPTLTVAFNANNTTVLYVLSTYNGVEGVNSDYLQNGELVRIGENDDYYPVVAVGGTVFGLNGVVKLHLQQPVTVKEGTIIYPIDEYTSDSLYVTNIITSSDKMIHRGDGVSVSLGYVWNQTDPITITRTMPTLDYVIESNNRLWGCRYGLDDKGNFVNQIYASALGDFKNWSVFTGTSADSYFATVGTSGPFTGAVNYMGYPVFFKEDCIHTIYGSYPSQYQINTMIARGVQSGSHKSLTVINEVLYYKSIDGVMAYTGTLPSFISYKLGKDRYYKAVACGYRDKLYIAMSKDKDSTSSSELFVYDINYGTWYKESEIDATELLSTKDDIYYLSGYELKSLFGTGQVEEETVEWFTESGLLGIYTSNKKYITKMNVRLWLDTNTTVVFYIKYDSDDDWRTIKEVRGDNKIKSVCLPILPRRFDSFKIRIEGKGNAKIYSISKTIEEGSDM